MAKKKVKEDKKALKKKAKKGGKRRPLGRGAKVFLTLIGLTVLVLGAWVGIDRLAKALREAKVIEVAVDLEAGGEGTDPGRFREPWGIFADAKGGLVVADFGNHRIQRIDDRGASLEVVGKRGAGEGEFEQPCSVWTDQEGNYYVADTFNHRIQKLDPKGRFLMQWKRSFFGPRGITGDGKGRIYISDTGNHKVQIFDTEGRFLKEFGRFGTKDGEFQEPQGIAADPEGNVYVCDSENRRIQKFTSKGDFLYAFKVPGWRGKCCEVAYPVIAQDSILVTNTSENCVLRLSLEGKLLAIYRKANGFTNATGLAVDPQGRIWVSMRSVHKIARFTPPPTAPKK